MFDDTYVTEGTLYVSVGVEMEMVPETSGGGSAERTTVTVKEFELGLAAVPM